MAFRRSLVRMCEEGAKKAASGGGGGGSLPNPPSGGAIAALGALVRGTALIGGAGALGYYSLFNVDAGHRAIIFNRVTGSKFSYQTCCLLVCAASRGRDGVLLSSDVKT